MPDLGATNFLAEYRELGSSAVAWVILLLIQPWRGHRPEPGGRTAAPGGLQACRPGPSRAAACPATITLTRRLPALRLLVTGSKTYRTVQGLRNLKLPQSRCCPACAPLLDPQLRAIATILGLHTTLRLHATKQSSARSTTYRWIWIFRYLHFTA